MKKLILISSVLVASCATQPQPVISRSGPPVVPVVLDPQVQQMSRNEVIQANAECESNHMRAVPIISKRMVSGMMSDIIIDVQCMPRLRWFQ